MRWNSCDARASFPSPPQVLDDSCVAPPSGLVTDRVALTLSPGAWEVLSLAIRLCPTEVSGLATAHAVDDGYEVDRAFLLKQVASDVDTRIDPDALADFLVDFVMRGDDPVDLCVWWHSHAREQVFWSSDDEQTIRALAVTPFISIVGNHAGRYLARRDTPGQRMATWLDLTPPGPPPSLDGTAADAMQALLDTLVVRASRRTTRPWTDDGPDAFGGHG